MYYKNIARFSKDGEQILIDVKINEEKKQKTFFVIQDKIYNRIEEAFPTFDEATNAFGDIVVNL